MRKTLVNDVFRNGLKELRCKLKALTLPEVLIAIGIIGIVAAMVLPMFTRNYRYYVLQQQFKHAYALVDVSVMATQIDMGEYVECFYTPTLQRDHCSYFFSELMKQLQTSTICETDAIGLCLDSSFRGGEEAYAETQGGSDYYAAKEYFNNSCSGLSTDAFNERAAVYVADSGFIVVPYITKEGTLHSPLLMLDANGQKGPNKWGYDIMVFEFGKINEKDSTFIMMPSQKCHPLDKGGVYTTTFVERLYGPITNY